MQVCDICSRSIKKKPNYISLQSLVYCNSRAKEHHIKLVGGRLKTRHEWM